MARQMKRKVKLILLLMKCNKPVLWSILKYCMQLARKTIGSPEDIVDVYLKERRRKIEKKLPVVDCNNTYMQILFPPDGSHTELKNWDLTLLNVVLKDTPELPESISFYLKKTLQFRDELRKLNSNAFTHTLFKESKRLLSKLRSKCYKKLKDATFAHKIEADAAAIQSGGRCDWNKDEILLEWISMEENTVKEILEKEQRHYDTIKLLLYGPSCEVMRALVTKMVRRKRYHSLDGFLSKNKGRIMRRIDNIDKSGRQTAILFPGRGDRTDISKWDLVLLRFILMNACYLEDEIADCIDDIRNVRNKLVHSESCKLTDSDYKPLYTKLTESLHGCLTFIDDKQLTKRIRQQIKDTDSGNNEKEDIKEWLKTIDENERKEIELLEKSLKAQGEISSELNELLKTRFSGQQNVRFDTNISKETEVEIVISNCPEEKESDISDDIVAVFNEVINNQQCERCVGENDLTNAVSEIVEKWKVKGMTITRAVKGSVLLKVKCASFSKVCELYGTYKGEGSTTDVRNLQLALRKGTGFDITLRITMYEREMAVCMEETVKSLQQIIIKEETERIQALNSSNYRHSSVKIMATGCYGNVRSKQELTADITNQLEKISNTLRSTYNVDKLSVHTTQHLSEDNVTQPDETIYGLPAHKVHRKALGDGIEEDSSIRVNIVANVGQGKTSLVRRLIGNAIDDEKRYGPHAYELIRKTLGDGIEEDSSIRVNIVGISGQGKTSLVNRLIGNGIDNIQSTNGIDIAHYKCQRDIYANTTYEENPGLNLSDIAKRNKAAFRSVEKKKAKLDENFERRTAYKPTEMSEEETNKLIRTIKRTKEHVSSNKTFDIWDFSGQYVFYATHTLFHSRKAIYLLVFNLSCGLTDIVPNYDEDDECCTNISQRTMEYYIRFWVNSIHSFVGNKDGTEPKIILVGTHFDNLKGDDRSKRRQADRYFDDVRAIFKGKQSLNHIFHQDFPVDNKDVRNDIFDSLKDAILYVGQTFSKSNKVPAKWIQLEKSLFTYRFTYREEKIVEFAKIIEIDNKNEYRIGSSEQIKQFLKHQHEQGTIVFFDEEPVSKYVVLDPQFLIDAFKCLITANRFITNMPDVYNAWQTLKTEGKLESTLIDKLWTNAENKLIMTHREILLLFLQKHRILSEASRFDENEQVAVGLGWFIVPSLLKDHSQEAEIRDFLKGKNQTEIQFVMSFDNSAVVPIVYHKLIAAVLGKWSLMEFRETKLLFKNLSIVRIDLNHAGLITLNDRLIKLSVLNMCPRSNVERAIADKFRRFAEFVIMYEFRKFQGVTENKELPYTQAYACNHESHGVSGSKNIATFGQEISMLSLPCPDLGSHRINIGFAKSEWYQAMKR